MRGRVPILTALFLFFLCVRIPSLHGFEFKSRFHAQSLSSDDKYSRSIPVAMTNEIAETDGYLKETFWNRIPAVELISTRSMRVEADCVRVRFAASRDILYLAAECYEREMDALDAEVFQNDDEALLLDDHLRLSISIESEKGSLYEIAINANGAVFDRRSRENPESWDSGVSAGVVKADNRYTIELALPLSSIGLKEPLQPGGVLRVNVTRLKQSDRSYHDISGGRFRYPALSFFGKLVWTASPEDVTPALVRGRIIDTDGKPVHNCSVVIAGENGVVTDESGGWKTNVLNGGALPFRLYHPGYFEKEGFLEVQTPLTQAYTIVLTPRDPYRYEVLIPPALTGYRVYPAQTVRPVYPDTPPPADGEPALHSFGAPGEYEPVSLAVYAQRDLDAVDIQVTSLYSYEGKMLPESNWDVRIVDRRLERKHYYMPPDSSVFTSRYLFPFQRFSLRSGHYRQIWLTVHVPENQKEGVYHGSVIVRPENAESITVPLTFEVLPFRLEESGNAYGGYYYGFTHYGAALNPTRDSLAYRDEIVSMKAHGFNTLISMPSIRFYRDGDAIRWSFDAILADMAKRMECDFMGPMIVSTGFEQLGSLLGYKRDPNTMNLDTTFAGDARFWELSKRALEDLLRLKAEKGWPELIMTHMDEVFGRGRLPVYIILSRAVRQIPELRLYMTHTVGNQEMMELANPYIDLHGYHGIQMDDWLEKGNAFETLAGEIDREKDEAWMYYNISEIRDYFNRSAYYRVSNGFYLWASPIAGHTMWGISYYDGNPFDTMDGDNIRHVKDDYGFFFPSDEDGRTPVPTLAYEMFREGVDDMRYLKSLERAIQEAEKAGDKQEAVNRAKGFLASVKSSVNRGGRSVESLIHFLPPSWFQETRREAALITTALLK